ncbi:MAG: radical SAM protein [Planctomycetota bacterium]|jgi:MoaA/NifB/PqqE/SkfB family radical SAM enzyme
MLPIERLLADIGKAVEHAAGENDDAPSFLADPMRLLSVVADGEHRRLESERRLGVPVPRFCIFSVTWRCNLSCTGCYTKSYARGKDMPPTEIERVLRQACELGSFLFVIVGGEPLLVEGLIDMLAGITDGLFFLFTNGTLLTAEHAGRLSAAANILPVLSLEGDEQLTDDRRGRGVAAKVAAAMRTLREANVAFGFAAMVTHRNLETVTSRAWFDELWQAGARFGFLLDYVPLPAGRDESLVLTAEDRRRQAGLVEQRYGEARPLVVNFPPDEYAFGPCQSAGRGFIHINADGYVEPCPFSHYAADNVREKPLAEILGSRFFSRLREHFKDTPNPEGHCILFARQPQVEAIARQTGAFSTDLTPAGQQRL